MDRLCSHATLVTTTLRYACAILPSATVAVPECVLRCALLPGIVDEQCNQKAAVFDKPGK